MHLPADNSDEPGPSQAAKPFLAHLDDLRWSLVHSLLALCAGMLIAIPFARTILQWLEWPLRQAGKDPAILSTLEVAGGFAVAMRIVIWTGLLISMPFILFFIGRFIAPGLTKVEKRVIARAGFFAGALFLFGVFMGYFAILPIGLQVMFGIADWIGVQVGPIRITDYISFCLQLLLGFGIAFEFPVLLVVLGRLGIITSGQLRDKRRHMIVVILTLAMFLTPGPDIFSQLLMAIPLIGLYELSIWLIASRERRSAYEGKWRRFGPQGGSRVSAP